MEENLAEMLLRGCSTSYMIFVSFSEIQLGFFSESTYRIELLCIFPFITCKNDHHHRTKFDKWLVGKP